MSPKLDTQAEIADKIEAALENTSSYPTFDSNFKFAESCLISRLSEISKTYRNFDIDPTRYIVTCTEHDFNRWTNILEHELIPISYLKNTGEEDHGTFSVMVDADHPLTIWIKDTLGISYDQQISEAEWETRWILQIKDGMNASNAKKTAQMLAK